MKKNTVYLLLSFAGMIAVFLWMRNQGAPLKTAYTPAAIVDLEFAWTQQKAEHIMLAWRNILDVARVNIYIDFLFIITYTAFLSLSCSFFSGKTTGKWAGVGHKLSKAVIAAGVFDVAENALMLTTLQGTPNNMTAMITATFAALKFAIAAIAVLYILASLPVWLLRRK